METSYSYKNKLEKNRNYFKINKNYKAFLKYIP